MGTQVITRDTGRRLGVVGEVVVDIDRREVVALGLRDNPLTRFLPGLPRWMPLESIRQVGDVILVDSADSLSESFNPERYSKVINCQVVTESGAQLGRVLGFSFDIETGELTTLVIGALGVPLLGEGVLSTWELAVGEIVSSGTDRIIVYEGAEEKLKQLGTGLLEKLGIGGSSWEQEERERFRTGVVPAENQLAAGLPSATEQRRIQPATTRAVENENELDYLELDDRREREPLRQRRYLDDDLDEREPGRQDSPRMAYNGSAYDRDDFGRDAGRGDDDRSNVDSRDRAFERGGPDRREFASPELGRFNQDQRDRVPAEPPFPQRSRTQVERSESDPLTRSRPREGASAERLGEEPLWRDQDAGRGQASRYGREPEAEPRRDWREDSQPARRQSWDNRTPSELEDSNATVPGLERRPPDEPAQPARRPLAAEARPTRAISDRDPIDVEPELLDDPW
jgi:sporulation protein YlmC with PRC-barrel domain